jgi:hypothetical protein
METSMLQSYALRRCSARPVFARTLHQIPSALLTKQRVSQQISMEKSLAADALANL